MKVLIGVDDSEESRHAVDVAFATYGPQAEYTIVSVGMRAPMFAAGYAGGSFATAEEIAATFSHAEGQATAAAAAAEERLPGADVDVEIPVGDVGSSLCTIASDDGSDVIVIGSHDKSAWQRLFDPSVGRYLIDHAPCPVLVVR